MRNFYITGGGGLGDILRNYLLHDRRWGCLEDIKKKYPKGKIKAIFCCHNPQCVEFAKLNPHIDETTFAPWQLDGTPIYDAHKDDYETINHQEFDYKKPKFYLSKEEEKFVKSIKKPFIFIHPFAGLEDHIGWHAFKYNEVIDVLIDQLKYHVVVVGASYTRLNQGGSDSHNEIFTYQRDGLYNLVNDDTSIRVKVQLASICDGFIGNHSCFVLIPWVEEIRSILTAPKWLEPHLLSHDANSWVTRLQLPFNKIIYTDGLSQETFIEEVIKWFK